MSDDREDPKRGSLLAGDTTKRLMDNERGVIVGLTSTCARLIGLALRDGRLDVLDETIEGLEAAVDGLERFGDIAGCDSGTEYTRAAIRQMCSWMRARDYGAASMAMNLRSDKDLQPNGYYESIRAMMREQGFSGY